ncbi:hypothetical protein BVG80_04045 [Sphingobacteriales bacterium TSM_CSM]|nr:hypothetical protein BVG80_04045 [Sphingobacteriales bacterium TSM_CSM]
MQEVSVDETVIAKSPTSISDLIFFIFLFLKVCLTLLDFQLLPVFEVVYLSPLCFFYFFLGVGEGLGVGLGAGLLPLFGPDGLPVLLGQFGFVPVFFAINNWVNCCPTRLAFQFRPVYLVSGLQFFHSCQGL